jgi:hypothetical protein
MKLPKLVIESFRRSCQTEMNDIGDFLAEHAHADFTPVDLEGLGRLRMTLWNQWRRMEVAWCDHDLADGNVGPEALAKLGKIVETTGVAVGGVLRASGRILEEGQGVQGPEPTPPFPEDTVTDQPQECVIRNAGDITALPARAGEVAVATRSGAGC